MAMAFEKFDPSQDPANVHKNFVEYIAAYAYEYEATKKPAPAGTEDLEAWNEQNKRRQFLGKYVSREFQRDFEDAVEEDRRATITFSEMVAIMEKRYKPTRNTTLANFEFHKLRQREGERFDDFVNRVKKEAGNCEFSCSHDDCDVPDTLIRDQVVIGTINDEIRRNALKDQWSLEELSIHSRPLEAASRGAKKITSGERFEALEINKLSGKYSRKTRLRQQQGETYNTDRKACEKYKSKSCRGGKECFAYDKSCFVCGKQGHVRGSKACKGKAQKNPRTQSHTNRVEKNEVGEDDSSSDYSSSEEELRNPTKGKIRKCKLIGHVRRAISRKPVSVTPSDRYSVDIVVKENVIKAYADTGADICVMSQKVALELGLEVTRTRMKLHPFGSKEIRCTGSYIGTVIFKDCVANVKFYIVPKQVETLLSGAAAEVLGIISLNTREALFYLSCLCVLCVFLSLCPYFVYLFY